MISMLAAWLNFSIPGNREYSAAEIGVLAVTARADVPLAGFAFVSCGQRGLQFFYIRAKGTG